MPVFLITVNAITKEFLLVASYINIFIKAARVAISNKTGSKDLSKIRSCG
jgi:hypothetical protein